MFLPVNSLCRSFPLLSGIKKPQRSYTDNTDTMRINRESGRFAYDHEFGKEENGQMVDTSCFNKGTKFSIENCGCKINQIQRISNVAPPKKQWMKNFQNFIHGNYLNILLTD